MENEFLCSNQEIVKVMMDLEVVPSFPVEQLDKQGVVKLPLAELALAGGALANMSENFRIVTQTISIPNDGLFRFDSRGAVWLRRSYEGRQWAAYSDNPRR